MNSLFAVSTSDWGGNYAIFYLIAFIVGSLILLYEGHRRKWPLTPWLIVIAWCAMWGIIGSKLLVISFGEWKHALHHGCLPSTTEKSYLGGILGGIIGVFFARRLLGVRSSVSDTFAFALPIGLAIGRVGCFLGGCCFGTPTGLPWAVVYPVNSHAYDVHLAKGLISPNALTSLPVHPAQLYEIVFLFALVILLWKCRRILKKPGSLLYLSIALYSIFRFFEEFIREGGSAVWGLKIVQWGLFLVILSVSAFLIRRELTCRNRSQVIKLPRDILHKNLIAISAIPIFLFAGKDWFTPLEMTTLTIATLPALVGGVIQVTCRFANSYIRWVAITVTLSLMIFIGSSFDTDTLPDTSETSYYNISLSGMTGSYVETCGPTHRYNVVGLGLSYTQKLDRFTKHELGVRSYIGNDINRDSYQILGINPYLQADFRWAGFGIGAHTGDLYFDGDPLSSSLQISLRLGPSDIFFIEGKYADHSPGSFPAPIMKGGIGLGFKNGSSLRLGVSEAGFYFEPYITTKHRITINPFFAYGDEKTYQLGLTLRYRLGTR